MKNNTSPGRDLIVGHWIKQLTSTHDYLMKSYENLLQQRTELPRWLTLTRTTMLPKNKDTDNLKNFRPIACQNNMFKLYTAIIANFLDNHCQQNNIITLNQAGEKKVTWGYIDQLLLNTTITEEVKNNRRNLMSIWLDYRKAFDSVPHTWIIECLKLAKVHPVLVRAIEMLMRNWSTKLQLQSENEMIESEYNKHLRGIFLGDSLSLLLFILTVNPHVLPFEYH